jgi:transposase InsO family protein
MPWKVSAVHEVRFALVHSVRQLQRPVAAAARDFGVSRKTAHKWLAVHDRDPAAAAAGAASLLDRSRRPRCSPNKTPDPIEHLVLQVRDRFNWGPRKIHFYLRQQHADRFSGRTPPLPPAVRTVADILARHGRVRRRTDAGDPAPLEPQRFERDQPNQLWQVDFKGPVEVARRKLMPLSVLDDHSRYCLAYHPCPDVTMASAWRVLWDLFGEVGLPEAILCDNAFSTMGSPRPAGISWFDSQLVLLGVRPAHGRPYHPQTQGKVERLHGCSVRELIDFNARRDNDEHFEQDCHRWRTVYNTLRPHEALHDLPPLSRWRPSPRPRPRALPPEPTYPPGSLLRRVNQTGTITFRSCRILCGRGIAGRHVRLEERQHELAVFFDWKQIRQLSCAQLRRDTVL